MSKNDNILGLLRIWIKWKKTILTLCVIVAVASSLASWFFMKNYYQSTTVFYAASPDIQKPDKLFSVTPTETFEYFGTPDDVNRVLAIAESAELRDYLTQRFTLYVRYGYDSLNPKTRHDFNEHFKEIYRVEKNKLDAIELSIEDTEREFSKEIVFAARHFIDTKVTEMIKQSQLKIVDGFQSTLKQQTKDLKILGDSMKRIRANYGIYNTETQSEILTNLISVAQTRLARISAQVKALEKEHHANQDTIMMLRSLQKGLENEVVMLRQNNNNLFNSGVNEVTVLSKILTQRAEKMGNDVVRLEQFRTMQQADISSIYVVQEPQIPMIKSRPKRSLIVLAAVFLTFVFTTLGAILLENYKKIDWNALKEDVE
jgi:tyrosine-protein kinase Etk/Wzc